MTHLVFTSPILLKCQYLKNTWMCFGQIRSQWSPNGTISCLCKLTIQDGCQWLLLKIANENDNVSRTTGWNWPIFVPECFLYEAVLIVLYITISNLCKLTIQDGRQRPLLKKKIKTKMTISHKVLVKIDQTLSQNISCVKPFWFLQFGIPRWPPFAVTKKSTERENGNISITA